MLMRIQMSAVIIVTRVKTSPALVPKALEPPAAPKAPARPPPLPRWIRTRQIMKSEVRISSEVRMPLRICTAGVLCPCGPVDERGEDPMDRALLMEHARASGGRSVLAPGGHLSGRLDDGEEVARLEAGATDQGAVDVG